MFYEIELVNQKKNIYQNFQVNNSKCGVILRKSISLLDFVTREFRTSSISRKWWDNIFATCFILIQCYVTSECAEWILQFTVSHTNTSIFKGALMQIWKSPYMFVFKWKIILWKFCILSPSNSKVIYP